MSIIYNDYHMLFNAYMMAQANSLAIVIHAAVAGTNYTLALELLHVFPVPDW